MLVRLFVSPTYIKQNPDAHLDTLDGARHIRQRPSCRKDREVQLTEVREASKKRPEPKSRRRQPQLPQRRPCLHKHLLHLLI